MDRHGSLFHFDILPGLPKVRSQNGLQIHNSAWRLLGSMGLDLQIRNLRFFMGGVFRSIFRFFDEDRDGFLSHEDEDHVFAYENCCESKGMMVMSDGFFFRLAGVIRALECH